MLYTFSCHSSPPTVLPSSLTSSYHLFLGLPLSLVFFYGLLFYTLFCRFLYCLYNWRYGCCVNTSKIIIIIIIIIIINNFNIIIIHWFLLLEKNKQLSYAVPSCYKLR
jgi:hypothetical protein